jgi:hypothetical protein
LDRIRKKYNEIGDVWDKSDRWHAWSKRQIDEEMLAVSRQFALTNDNSALIVDVGSGGYSTRLARSIFGDRRSGGLGERFGCKTPIVTECGNRQQRA